MLYACPFHFFLINFFVLYLLSTGSWRCLIHGIKPNEKWKTRVGCSDQHTILILILLSLIGYFKMLFISWVMLNFSVTLEDKDKLITSSQANVRFHILLKSRTLVQVAWKSELFTCKILLFFLLSRKADCYISSHSFSIPQYCLLFITRVGNVFMSKRELFPIWE